MVISNKIDIIIDVYGLFFTQQCFSLKFEVFLLPNFIVVVRMLLIERKKSHLGQIIRLNCKTKSHLRVIVIIHM